jgi:hypothetical protein
MNNELSPIGFTENSEYLRLKDTNAVEYRLRIDEKIKSMILFSDTSSGERTHKLTPKYIQKSLRAGLSIKELSKLTGIDMQSLEKFEAPVATERKYVITKFMTSDAQNAKPQRSIRSFISDYIFENGIKGENWEAFKSDDSPWMIRLTFEKDGSSQMALWSFDTKTLLVKPKNALAKIITSESDFAKDSDELENLDNTQAENDTAAETVGDLSVGNLKASKNEKNTKSGAGKSGAGKKLESSQVKQTNKTSQTAQTVWGAQPVQSSQAKQTNNTSQTSYSQSVKSKKESGKHEVPELKEHKIILKGENDTIEGKSFENVGFAEKGKASAKQDAFKSRNITSANLGGPQNILLFDDAHDIKSNAKYANVNDDEEKITAPVIRLSSTSEFSSNEVHKELDSKKRKRKGSRPQIPSWDEIIFGSNE